MRITRTIRQAVLSAEAGPAYVRRECIRRVGSLRIAAKRVRHQMRFEAARITSACLMLMTLAWTASPASAMPPASERFDFDFVESLPTALCGFPLDVRFEGQFAFTVFFDESGNPVRVQLNAQDEATVTNPSNGMSLTGRETVFRQATFEKGQEFSAGLPIHFGRAVMDAGRIYFDSQGGARFSGNHQFEAGDLTDFCAALA